MKTTTIVLLVLVATLVAAAPATATEHVSEEKPPCVKVSAKPPGVYIDPECFPLEGASELFEAG